MDVESKEIDIFVVKQKFFLSLEVMFFFMKSFFLMLFLNLVDYNGELFSGEGFKMYLRKVIFNKWKLGMEDNFVEDNLIVKKVLMMGNKELFEIDCLKDIIFNNSKVEFVKRLNKKFVNLYLEEKIV